MDARLPKKHIATYEEIGKIRARLSEVIQMIDVNTRHVKYRDGHTDASIAKELSVGIGSISKQRREQFGQLHLVREKPEPAPKLGPGAAEIIVWRLDVEDRLKSLEQQVTAILLKKGTLL